MIIKRPVRAFLMEIEDEEGDFYLWMCSYLVWVYYVVIYNDYRIIIKWSLGLFWSWNLKIINYYQCY